MFANLANSKKIVRATVGGVLATLLILAPGAAAVGADVIGNAQGQLSGSANAAGALGTAHGLVDDVQAKANGAAATAASAQASVAADATVRADGAQAAAAGFFAEARGYVSGLLQKIFGAKAEVELKASETKATAESEIGAKKALVEGEVATKKALVESEANSKITTVSHLKGQAEARAHGAVATASSLQAPAAPAIPEPKVQAGLTASLQAAFAGILTLL